jgi:hypothetical protein
VIALLAIAGGYTIETVFPSNKDYSAIINVLAQAIATAEGFYVSGSKAQRQNNPGNITDASGIASYPTADAGWAALYRQIGLMFSGSAIYNTSMTLAEIAYYYADGAHDPQGATNWANNVASYLGVTPDTTLSALAAQYT